MMEEKNEPSGRVLGGGVRRGQGKRVTKKGMLCESGWKSTRPQEENDRNVMRAFFLEQGRYRKRGG